MSDNSNFIHNDKDNAIVYSERKRILFLGLPWTFTKYIITPEYITIRQGLFNRVEDDCYMYKVQDVNAFAALEQLYATQVISQHLSFALHMSKDQRR